MATPDPEQLYGKSTIDPKDEDQSQTRIEITPCDYGAPSDDDNTDMRSVTSGSDHLGPQRTKTEIKHIGNATPHGCGRSCRNLELLGSTLSVESRMSRVSMQFLWLSEVFPPEYADGKMQLSREKFVRFVNASGTFSEELFAALDSDNSGSVSRREFLGAFGKLRCRPSQQKLLNRLGKIVSQGGNAYCEYDIDQFKKILSKDALICIFDLFDVNDNGLVSTSEIQRSLEKISCMDNNAKILAWMDDQFTKIAGEKRYITKEEFQKALNCKNTFFVDRMFSLLDVDNSGSLELKEVIDGITSLMRGDRIEKLRFLFHVYDSDNSGSIDRDELSVYLRNCLDESCVQLPPYQLERLVSVFFDDADTDRSGYITFEELEGQFEKHAHMLDDLCLTAGNWLRPTERKSRRKFKKPQILSSKYLRNNASAIVFWTIYILLSIGLFVEAASRYWSNSNALVVIARGSGQLLNFNSAFVLTLTFRNTITWLRNTILSRIINFDIYISVHKAVGFVILFFSLLHAAMHFANFGVLSSTTSFTFAEYVFTTKPGLGWVAGSAALTGDILLLVLIIMVIFALPCIRSSGKFLLFYLTHQLYIVYLILLILHGPNFWKWFIAPGVFLLVEIILRMKCVIVLRYGKTSLLDARTLPSNVTHLVIKRPEKFKFTAGDYVFLNIPLVADFEWHPFTISSAPEEKDYIWIHVRTVGNWTNSLHELIEEATESEKAGRHIEGAKQGIKRFAVTQRQRMRLENAKSTTKHRDSIKSAIHKMSTRQVTPSDDMTLKTVDAFQSGVKNSRSGSGKDTDDVVIHSGATGIRVYLDGPYGAPAADVFSTDHAVLVAAGIGVTPFACILQSIMNRYTAAMNKCPKCNHEYMKELPRSIMQLRKVDFMWINRDQRSFDWFLSILAKIEEQQKKLSSKVYDRFIDIHLYLTSLLKKNDIRAVGLQMALDLMHEVENEDVITGLKTQMEGGRPDFDMLFQRFVKEGKGAVTVFYCGPRVLGNTLNEKCMQYGFKFKREIF